MNRQRALFAIHIAAVLFGLTGIFGELIQADAMVITAGRASFAVIALLAFIRYQGASPIRGIKPRDLVTLAIAGAMLAVHWVTFSSPSRLAGWLSPRWALPVFPPLLLWASIFS